MDVHLHVDTLTDNEGNFSGVEEDIEEAPVDYNDDNAIFNYGADPAVEDEDKIARDMLEILREEKLYPENLGFDAEKWTKFIEEVRIRAGCHHMTHCVCSKDHGNNYWDLVYSEGHTGVVDFLDENMLNLLFNENHIGPEVMEGKYSSIGDKEHYQEFKNMYNETYILLHQHLYGSTFDQEELIQTEEELDNTRQYWTWRNELDRLEEREEIFDSDDEDKDSIDQMMEHYSNNYHPEDPTFLWENNNLDDDFGLDWSDTQDDDHITYWAGQGPAKNFDHSTNLEMGGDNNSLVDLGDFWSSVEYNMETETSKAERFTTETEKGGVNDEGNVDYICKGRECKLVPEACEEMHKQSKTL
jgi:hypothetical protein